MRFPAGTVVALSSASSTVFSIGMIYLSYWGLHEPGPWRIGERIVVAVALGGFACLGSVPWLASRPGNTSDDELGLLRARRAFLCGVSATWLAVVLSLLL